MLKIMIGALSGLTLALAVASAAAALPLAPAPTNAGPSAVVQIHGCHRGILEDRAGWHFNDRACRRHDVAPPGYVTAPGRRGSFTVPLCTYRCHFVGPVKMCNQVCR